MLKGSQKLLQKGIASIEDCWSEQRDERARNESALL